MPERWSRRLLRMRIVALMLTLWAGVMVYLCIPDQPLLAIFNGVLLVGQVYLSYLEWFVLQREWPGRRWKPVVTNGKKFLID